MSTIIHFIERNSLWFWIGWAIVMAWTIGSIARDAHKTNKWAKSYEGQKAMRAYRLWWISSKDKFHIVEDNDRDHFEEQVSEALKAGWVICGEAKIKTGPKMGDLFGLVEEYRQPMRKP